MAITARANAVAAVARSGLVGCLLLAASCGSVDEPTPVRVLPADAAFDYQIGGDYDPPTGTVVVTRDWFFGEAFTDGYAICYINAFQTQNDVAGIDRPDERSNWPEALVLSGFEDDPNWAGEYLIDISTAAKREAAADHLQQMIEVCADKGFDAVEFDNLDSWTRLAGLPFGRADAIEFARIITERGRALGLAVAQKNTADLGAEVSRDVIGFDFAVVEECGSFDECDRFVAAFGDAFVAVEYTNDGFAAACAAVGDRVSVVRRDLLVTSPESDDYAYDEC